MRKYKPENWWFGGDRPYRVTNTSGIVHLDVETQRVQFADVTFDMTWSDNYLDYLDNRNDARTVTVRYERSAATFERDSPDWTINHE